MEQKRKQRKKIVKVMYAGKRSVKQRIWDTMRRIKVFTPKDIQSLLEVKEHTVRAVFYALEVAGYIRKDNGSQKLRKKFSDATFVFITKEKILLAPIINSKEVYCTTTDTKTDLAARKLLLNALKEYSQREVADKLGISATTVNQILNNKYPNPERIADIYKLIRERL